MKGVRGSYLVAVLAVVACQEAMDQNTGLSGTAFLGPTRPVCPPGDSCTAPFKGKFEVRQQGQVVAQFETDSAGRFLVHLPPGKYTVGPDRTTGIIMRRQIHDVTVGSKGLTSIRLDFDTGISGVR